MIALLAPAALAHVPYLETQDFSPTDPFVVSWSVEKSIAVYGWLDGPTDVDDFRLEIHPGDQVYLEVLVPECAEYADFRPSMVLFGPGLPPAPPEVAGIVPPGAGAIVIDNPDDGLPRPTVYEPFGDKTYFEFPELDAIAPRGGTYGLAVYDPAGAAGTGGDYVAVIGTTESFSVRDSVRAAQITPIIRADGELHVQCL